MTKVEFLISYPEFEQAEPEFAALVDAKLAEADAATSDAWEGKRDQVHGLETAHRLALSPFGRNAKLVSEKGETTYGKQLKEMRIAFACALQRMA